MLKVHILRNLYSNNTVMDSVSFRIVSGRYLEAMWSGTIDATVFLVSCGDLLRLRNKPRYGAIKLRGTAHHSYRKRVSQQLRIGNARHSVAVPTRQAPRAGIFYY